MTCFTDKGKRKGDSTPRPIGPNGASSLNLRLAAERYAPSRLAAQSDCLHDLGKRWLPRAIRGTMEPMEPTTTQPQDSPSGPGVLPVIREYIVSTPDTCGGKPRIAGSRIQVKHIAIMHERQGMKPEEIVSEFPHLTLAGIYAALAYYHDHREEMNAEIAADRTWYEEQREQQPSRLKEVLKARMANAKDDPLPPR